MNKVFGILLMAAGIAFGLWAGLWWAFIGGIVGVITELKAVDISAMNMAFSIARIIFAGLIGWAAAATLCIPGYVMLKD